MTSSWIDVSVFATCGALFWFCFRGKTTRAAETRQQFEIGIFPTAEFEHPQQRVGFDYLIWRQIELARVPAPPRMVPWLVVVISGLVMSLTLALSDDMFAAALSGLLGLLCCLASIAGLAYWNVTKFRKQLPLAVEILTGSVKSGDSVQAAIGLLAETMQEPAKTEFVRCRNQLNMGLSLRETMQSLAHRIGTLDTKMFAKMLTVHRDTGGHLTSTLQRLAKVIRSRFEYERHLRSTTGMGRMSVIVVIALAWLIFGYIVVMKPDYGSKLWQEPLGHRMLSLALALELVGVIWAVSLIRSKY